MTQMHFYCIIVIALYHSCIVFKGEEVLLAVYAHPVRHNCIIRHASNQVSSVPRRLSYRQLLFSFSFFFSFSLFLFSFYSLHSLFYPIRHYQCDENSTNRKIEKTSVNILLKLLVYLSVLLPHKQDIDSTVTHIMCNPVRYFILPAICLMLKSPPLISINRNF